MNTEKELIEMADNYLLEAIKKTRNVLQDFSDFESYKVFVETYIGNEYLSRISWLQRVTYGMVIFDQDPEEFEVLDISKSMFTYAVRATVLKLVFCIPLESLCQYELDSVSLFEEEENTEEELYERYGNQYGFALEDHFYSPTIQLL